MDDLSGTESEGDAYRTFVQARQGILEPSEYKEPTAGDDSLNNLDDLDKSFAAMTTRPSRGPLPRKRPFTEMKSRSKINRLNSIAAIEGNWHCKIGEALPREIAPRVATSHEPEHKAQIGRPDRETEDPRDWGCAYLRWLVEYSALTKGKHEEAVKALVEFVRERQEDDGGVALGSPSTQLMSRQKKRKHEPKRKEADKFLKNARELTREDLAVIVKREDRDCARKRKERIRLGRKTKERNKAKSQKAISWSLPASEDYAHRGDALQPLLRAMLEGRGQETVGQTKVEEAVSEAPLGENRGSENGYMHPARRELMMKHHSSMSHDISVGFMMVGREASMDPVIAGLDTMKLSDDAHARLIKQEPQDG
ncbi:hypothetical protein W97_07265 [Coniosporium apollinis CBS 100218]|uniref:Uncharacterized protein n=1 Tax=Coniosporium apollinis (strain CBS 100218) TaxID=1168221 RepID=R7Z1V3_CONA1|nr:uncharacterized protein W97_07265 [Coniosporium apollinis CBS 100218]EON68117.1 hypothetical protein W97_07265 [Coniosporium apollinis CBS 100218]